MERAYKCNNLKQRSPSEDTLDPESIGAAVVFTRQLDKQALGRALPEIQAKNPEDLEAANGVLQQEGLGSVVWVIVGAAGSTGLAILVILFVVLNRNRKKLKGTRG